MKAANTNRTRVAPRRSFHADSLEVRIYESAAELGTAAANEAQAYLSALLAQQGSAAVILATGNSQLSFLEALVDLGGVEWSRVTLFHMDEYLGIEANHPASFRRYMRERVEARLRPQRFHYI